ncbi:hypothetical protein FE257_000679 [Aspergillus nanangensis]|uniref:Uncharacterized protein n=1 Tax=Aspergillus nanangensis TaxID=2582783 RepID=A0AAD4CG24_ASPNN|nr:hypothetical protein FE257_000679 [Aspergillus nanangensis]
MTPEQQGKLLSARCERPSTSEQRSPIPRSLMGEQLQGAVDLRLLYHGQGHRSNAELNIPARNHYAVFLFQESSTSLPSMLGFAQFPQYYNFQEANLSHDPSEFTQFPPQALNHTQPMAVVARTGSEPFSQRDLATLNPGGNTGSSSASDNEVGQEPEDF